MEKFRAKLREHEYCGDAIEKSTMMHATWNFGIYIY